APNAGPDEAASPGVEALPVLAVAAPVVPSVVPLVVQMDGAASPSGAPASSFRRRRVRRVPFPGVATGHCSGARASKARIAPRACPAVFRGAGPEPPRG